MVTAPAASGSVSNSQDLPPTYPNWLQNPTNWPCYATPSYACTSGGYDNSTALKSGWPNAHYGQGQASTNTYGMHNCTLYAAYRLEQNGLTKDPGNWGNARNWATAASADHFLVDQTPATGSIAQWNAGGAGKGHVAYVESVTYSGAGSVTAITITEDNFMPETGYGNLDGGYTAEVHITAGSAVWPANFIHPPSTWGAAIEVPGTAALNKGGFAEISSVSCASAGNCSAGGYYDAGSDHDQVFVVSEKNGAWGAAIEVPGTAVLNKGGSAEISSVSCASAGNCSAGGYYDSGTSHYQAFVVSERGGTWGTAIEVPGSGALNKDGFAGINSVSCTSAGNCSAGGYYASRPAGLTNRPTQAFVVSEKNGSWGTAIEVTGVATLNGTGVGTQVTSVSCVSPGNCSAGGGPPQSQGGPGYGQVFVVSEKDGAWGKAIEVPGTAALNKGGFAGISSVSCASAGNCSAGGYYAIASGGFEAFVVSEKDGAWGKAIEVPGTAALNKGGFAAISSVSCASAGNCSAGGSYQDTPNDPGQAFVVSEKNGAWGTAIEVPGTAALNKGDDAAISSVSCVSAGNCSAGGSYTDDSGSQAFVVAQVDGTWATATEVPGTAALNKGGSAGITSVSCVSAGGCSAGGYYYDGSHHLQVFVVSQG